MSIMDKMINKMSLNEDPDDDYLYDDEYDDEEEVKPKKSLFSKPDDDDDDYEEPPRQAPLRALRREKVTPMRQPKKGADGMEVCVIKPVNVEDSREITDTLLSDRTVVLNLEGLDLDVSQRIFDFASGACCAVRGQLDKISNYIFVLTPHDVDITGEFQQILTGTFDPDLDITDEL